MALAFTFGQSLVAQDSDRMAEIESRKVAFLTRKLDLSVGEAQGFWPIYNEYKRQADALRKEKRDMLTADIADMGEAESSALLDKILDLEDRELAARRQYAVKLKSALPSKKILLLIDLEKRFKKRLLKSIGKRAKKLEKRR